MKRHLISILGFILVLALIDVLAGAVFSRLTRLARGGDTARNEYICNGTHEDILVLGSSRAIHHYNPAIISDMTGMSCYNCGQDGNGAILNYGRYHLIAQRYRPQVVICDVMPEYDLLQGEDNRKFLGWLRPYYDREGIAAIFERVDRTEKVKMLSQMYRYNSRFIQILSDCVRPMRDDGNHGYVPIEGSLDRMKVDRADGPIVYTQPVDSLKLYYLAKLMDEAAGSQLIMVVSPCWSGMDTAVLQPLKQLCSQRDIPLLDFSNDPKYVHADHYFIDAVHLNAVGADEFTRDVMGELKALSKPMIQKPQ